LAGSGKSLVRQNVKLCGNVGSAPNILPIMPGWNYTMWLLRPRKENFDGTWKFPVAQPAK